CKPILGNDSNVSSSANANELGISNQAQVLSKVQTPFNNISIIPQQQITRSQREQSVTLTTRQESSQKSYSLDSSSRPSTSSSTSSFATDINSRTVQNQNNLSKIPTSTTFQRQIADKYQETYDMISQKSTSQQHESNNQQRFNISQQQGISHEVITIDAIEQQRQPTSQRSCMDISFQTPVTQRSVPNISEQTNQSLYNSQISPLPPLPLRIDQQQTSPIQTTNNLEIHALNQRPSSNDINSSQK
ncbi:18797_t:CDS:1, partial [Gigaspora rosea]